MDQEPVPDTGAGSRALAGGSTPPAPGAPAPTATPARVEPPEPSAPRVLLHTRPGCHLCDVAREAVARVCAEERVGWDEVDVDAPGAEDLRARWTDLVPVVTVDGRLHEHWRIDAERLRAALAGGAGGR